MTTPSTVASRPAVCPPGGGTPVESFHPLRMMLRSPSISVSEGVVRPGQEPPMHVHEREDEVFHVLDGRLTIWVDGAEHAAGSGACAFLPRGLPHTFAVDSESVRMLVICTPGGFEGMFAEIPAPVDMAVAGAAFERYGISVTGPNPRHA